MKTILRALNPGLASSLREGLTPADIREGLTPADIREGLTPADIREGLTPADIRDGLAPADIREGLTINDFRKGFTLIELMVVVAIIGLLAAVAVPLAVRMAHRTENTLEAERGQRSRDATEQKALQQPAPAEPAGVLPDFRSVDIGMRLEVDHHRVGMEVYNRYQATFSGKFVVRSPGVSGGPEDSAGPGEIGVPVRLFFPFPADTNEARDVSLFFLIGDKRLEAEGVRYDKKGIHWVGTLPLEPEVRVEAAFVAHGRERFIYSLPPAGRTHAVHITLELEGATPDAVPDAALQPTSVDGQRLTWVFNNLVTDRAIFVELPGADTPLGRVTLLFKLVGVAVLLFGLGFWYLAEMYRPGHLDDFRWGHFLLLASTYSLFFVIFAVLGFRGALGTWTEMGVAALLSLPLLVLHVSRIFDLRFALTRTLPLALFTLALVIDGVYGGPIRDYVFLAGAFLAIAFVTLTYRSFLTRREQGRKSLEASLLDRLDRLEPQILTAAASDRLAGLALRIEDGDSLAELRDVVEQQRSTLEGLVKELRTFSTKRAELLRMTNPILRNETRYDMSRRLRPLEDLLPPAVERLRKAVAGLLEAREGVTRKALEALGEAAEKSRRALLRAEQAIGPAEGDGEATAGDSSPIGGAGEAAPGVGRGSTEGGGEAAAGDSSPIGGAGEAAPDVGRGSTEGGGEATAGDSSPIDGAGEAVPEVGRGSAEGRDGDLRQEVAQGRETLRALLAEYEALRTRYEASASGTVEWLSTQKARHQDDLQTTPNRTQDELMVVQDAQFTTHQTIQRLRQGLTQARRALGEALRKLDERRALLRRLEPSGRARGLAHCLACGARGSDAPYCPECGTARPLRVVCERCGEVFIKPVHLMKDKARQEATHCLACGAVHVRPTDVGE